MDRTAVVVTCEHGGCEIPSEFQPLFRNFRELLNSHRGFDPGALELARDCAGALSAPLRYSVISRLLIDLNRSLNSKTLFSEITSGLPPSKKDEIIKTWYIPYRSETENLIKDYTEAGNLLIHLAVHSFTPVLRGEVRRCDVGLLYDPGRPGEKEFCEAWHGMLRKTLPGYRIRRNYPYHGTADGFTTHLRAVFPYGQYLGLEVEVNQKFFLENPDDKQTLISAVIDTFRTVLNKTKQ